MNLTFIDTHAHLNGEEYANDLPEVINRAKEIGVSKIFLPAIDLNSAKTAIEASLRYPNFLFPMIGLHPEEVKEDWQSILSLIKKEIHIWMKNLAKENQPIAIGEVGLDYYWSREFEKEQLLAFEEQIKWSIEYKLPLMIHCRKAQNEMVKLMRSYKKDLYGGVFHCFTGNAHEAAELLEFDNFVLGIGGICTFKKSPLAEMLAANVPLNRIVLETDSPYMAPVPMRGNRNESSYIIHVLKKLADAYKVPLEYIAEKTNENVKRVFSV